MFSRRNNNCDQGTLHKGCSAEFTAVFGNAALTFRFVRVAHPGHNAEVSIQFLFVLEVVDVADDAQQDRAAFLADALDAGDVLNPVPD